MPYMIDNRHAPDTLFIIAEEDFRLWPSDEHMDQDALAAAAWSQHAPADASGAASSFQEAPNQTPKPKTRVRLSEVFPLASPSGATSSTEPPPPPARAQPGTDSCSRRFPKSEQLVRIR